MAWAYESPGRMATQIYALAKATRSGVRKSTYLLEEASGAAADLSVEYVIRWRDDDGRFSKEDRRAISASDPNIWIEISHPPPPAVPPQPLPPPAPLPPRPPSGPPLLDQLEAIIALPLQLLMIIILGAALCKCVVYACQPDEMRRQCCPLESERPTAHEQLVWGAILALGLLPTLLDALSFILLHDALADTVDASYAGKLRWGLMLARTMHTISEQLNELIATSLISLLHLEMSDETLALMMVIAHTLVVIFNVLLAVVLAHKAQALAMVMRVLREKAARES